MKLTNADKAKLDQLKSKLTPKQSFFVEHYFNNNFNGVDAVLKAGYQANSNENARKIASQIVRKPYMKEYIELLQKQRLENVTVSPEYVLKKLVKNVEKAEEDNNLGAAFRGLELLARHLGMLRDRTEITGKDGEAIQLEKVENDAADFTRSILGIAKRGGKGSGATETSH